MKMDLFNLRLKVSKTRRSKPWTIQNLENAISGLKNQKARDPNGLINEIFKNGVAGRALKLSIPDYKKQKFSYIIEKGRSIPVMTVEVLILMALKGPL